MLLPSAVYPHAACIAKHLPHLHSSPGPGPGPVGRRDHPSPQRLPERGPGGPVGPGPGLAYHAPAIHGWPCIGLQANGLFAQTRIVAHRQFVGREWWAENRRCIRCLVDHDADHAARQPTQEVHQDRQVTAIRLFKGMDVACPVVARDRDRQVAVLDQIPVHQRSTGTAVAVREGMDLHEAVVQPGGDGHRMGRCFVHLL